MYLENFYGRGGQMGGLGRVWDGWDECGTSGTGGTGETSGTGRSVETYFLKLYLIDCEIVERLHIK